MKFIKQNITNKTLYTKHFYAESQRLASKLGAGLASSIVDPTQFQVTEVCSSYEEKSDSLLQMLERGWSRTAVGSAEIEPGNVSIENPELQVINDLAEVSADEPESDIYYYHSDHLGSSSWITDAGGDVNQHLQHLPFGEDYIYQRNTSWNISYTFSGKEKDSETGYSYFGARYYDSDISVWLSVDPLSDKYPSMSPFIYTAGNPVMLIDPDGRKIDDYFTKDGKYLGTDDAKTDNVRIIDESEWNKQSSVMGTMIIHDVGNDLSESPTDAEVSENAQMNIYNYYNPTDLTLLKDNSGDYNMTFRVEIIESIVNGNIVSTSSSAKEIGINVKRNYVSGYINNAADIKSLFEHEATHYNDFKSFPEKYLEIRETNNNRLELRAITNQLNQGYYKYCSDNFKKGIMTYSEEFGGILKKFNALPPTITN